MTLGFSQKFPDGKPTYFIEKINNGIAQMDKGYKNDVWKHERLYSEKFGFNLVELPATDYPKIHTIRKDSKDRWKVGNKIHFVINSQTKDRFQFAPVLEVKTIQEFEIKWLAVEKDSKDFLPMIWVDGRLIFDPVLLINEGLDQFAKNDGFEGIEDFLDWFSEDFTGKIIHWTDLTY